MALADLRLVPSEMAGSQDDCLAEIGSWIEDLGKVAGNDARALYPDTIDLLPMLRFGSVPETQETASSLSCFQYPPELSLKELETCSDPMTVLCRSLSLADMEYKTDENPVSCRSLSLSDMEEKTDENQNSCSSLSLRYMERKTDDDQAVCETMMIDEELKQFEVLGHQEHLVTRLEPWKQPNEKIALAITTAAECMQL